MKRFQPPKNVNKRLLVELGLQCQRCSIAFNDPHLIEACHEIKEKCWIYCPLCSPERYTNFVRPEVEIP